MTDMPMILLVDDDPQSLRVMGFALTEAGYRVAAAKGGEACFEVLPRCQPDLILCDVIMPDIGGIEVCRRLKDDPATRDIPLIFLTSRTETEDLLEGFTAGAVDYIAKPFNTPELLARVKTHTELKRARDTILESAARLEALNSEKDHILGIVAHDLRNPLSAIQTAKYLIDRQVGKGEAPAAQLLEIIDNSCKNADALIQELLEVADLEQKRLAMAPIQAENFLQNVLSAFDGRAQAKHIKLVWCNQTGQIQLNLNRVKMGRALDNLLHNALKFTPDGGEIRVTLGREGDKAWIDVADTGIGIPPELQEILFEKFTQARRRGLGGERAHGLGMHIVQEIVHRHGGTIQVFSEVNQGTRFKISLPLSEAN